MADANQKMNKAFEAFNAYISSVSNRDRVTSIFQFLGMVLAPPAEKAGHKQMAHNCRMITEIASTYRCVTRFSQWFVVIPILNPMNWKASLKASVTPMAGILKIVYTAFFTVFLFSEELRLFAKHKMCDMSLADKLNRVRFVCVFYSNLVRTIHNCIVLKETPFDEAKDGKDAAKVRKNQVNKNNLMDGVLQTMFAYTLLKASLPAGPGNMSAAIKSGSIVDMITSLAPPVFVCPMSPQGVLGIVASIPAFQTSLL